MVVTTTGCAAFDHPEFRLEADEASVPPTYLTATARTIEEMVAGGSVFRPGQTFQIGWMVTSVCRDGGGRLTLHEPDGRAMPIRFVPGLTHTLRTQMLQRFVADSLGLWAELDLPSVRQSAVVCDRYADRGGGLIAARSEPTDDADFGWFLGCGDDAHDHNDPAHLRRVSLYQAWLDRPDIQGWVGLPRRVSVLLNDDGPAFFRGDQPLAIVAGSYLDAVRQQRADDDR